MLERLVGKAYYCFLDGYLGYNQIVVDPEDQEKTTFTYPFGVLVYRKMSFVDFVEKCIEVFMDVFSIFGSTFNNCLKI